MQHECWHYETKIIDLKEMALNGRKLDGYKLKVS